jgi:hypothetical protein
MFRSGWVSVCNAAVQSGRRMTVLDARAGEPVAMPHLLRAARMEFAKLERPFPDAEVRGWA